MNKDILAAYEKLVPTDQLIVDAIIVTLHKKDEEIRRLSKHIMDSLNKTGQGFPDHH